jgi:periplasmic divalent cation tolerance protein
MPESDCIVVLITAQAGSEAALISKTLLEQRKASCVSIINGMESSYWWQGKIDSAEESLLIVKTGKSLLGEIVHIVKEIHKSEIPEIIALPIIGGNQDYLDWVNREII